MLYYKKYNNDVIRLGSCGGCVGSCREKEIDEERKKVPFISFLSMANLKYVSHEENAPGLNLGRTLTLLVRIENHSNNPKSQTMYRRLI